MAKKSEVLANKIATSGGTGGVPSLLGDSKKTNEDIRTLRRLIRSPVHVPTEYFLEAAGKLWTVATTTTDDRVKVNAIKAITDICKVNLLVRERYSDKPEINLHLHKHEHDHTLKIAAMSEDELLQLKSLMEKAGLN